MNYFLNTKKIKDICGEISYKKGKKYFQDNKVVLKNFHPSDAIVNASVKGNGLFHVVIKKGQNGFIHAECTCPQLESFHKKCQHVAAVLVLLHDIQVNGGKEAASLSTSNTELVNEVFEIFENSFVRPIRSQYHMENRAMLFVQFTCEIMMLQNGQYLMGIAANIQSYKVTNFRGFLIALDKGEGYAFSNVFSYNPKVHSFTQEDVNVLKRLLYILQNFEATRNEQLEIIDKSWLLIPPTEFESLLYLLHLAPDVQLEHHRAVYEGVNILSKQTLPLIFHLDQYYCFTIKNLEHIIVMDTYSYVLYKNNFYKLSKEDSFRLSELKYALAKSEENQLQIEKEQLPYFLDKVVPHLTELGSVEIASNVKNAFPQIPPKAKLFLDRVNNKLLAALEFEYGNVTINPLEDGQSVLNRDHALELEVMSLMEAGLFTRTESGYFMHNEEAEYDFLHYMVPEISKFVNVYATTAVKERIVKHSSPPNIRIEVDERTDWLIFEFDMHGIPENEIRSILLALTEKRKYYRLTNGALLSLETKAFQEMQRFLYNMGITLEQIEAEEIRVPFISNFYKLGTLNENVLVRGKSLQAIMDDLLHPEKLEFTVPDSINASFREYQIHGFKWLKALAHYKFGGILADDMGLGKTLQSIMFIVSVLPEIRQHHKPVLVVCPSSLVYNWLNELAKFSPQVLVKLIEGDKGQRAALLKDISEVDVVIVSYSLLRMDMNSYQSKSFHTIIFDEAQAFKNPASKTAKAVKALRADNRFALTGTPIENSVDNLWSILNVVFPTLLPERKMFKSLAHQTIKKLVNPFILRRLKEEVLLELPEKMELVLTSDLLPEQKKLYAAYLAKLKVETLEHLNKETFQQNKLKILAGITRLRQICCHPALFVEGYTGSSAKFEHVIKIVQECYSSKRRILIFSQFTAMLTLIGRELHRQGVVYFYLDGSTPAAERVTLCERFNAGEGDVFLISLKAGGTGLNLTGADTVIHYDLWWNPAVEQQASDRAYRMGQKNNVQVMKLIAKGTIEEKINELQEKKKNLIQAVIESDNENLTMLSEREIKDILMIE